MSKEKQNDVMLGTIKRELDASLDELDGETLSRITRARNNALDSQQQKEQAWGWIPAGAVASICMALLVYVFMSDPAVEESLQGDELELISNIEDIELLEDLEFYEWLEEYELPT